MRSPPLSLSYAMGALVALLTGGFLAATKSHDVLAADPACHCTNTAGDNVGTPAPCLGLNTVTNRSCSTGGLGAPCTVTENVAWAPYTPNCIASVGGVSGKIDPLPFGSGSPTTFDATQNQSWNGTNFSSQNCASQGTVFGWAMSIGNATSNPGGCSCLASPAFNEVARSEWLCKYH